MYKLNTSGKATKPITIPEHTKLEMAFKTNNSIGKALKNKNLLRSNKYSYSGAYQLTFPEFKKWCEWRVLQAVRIFLACSNHHLQTFHDNN
jgi:hypothetical protein